MERTNPSMAQCPFALLCLFSSGGLMIAGTFYALLA